MNGAWYHEGYEFEKSPEGNMPNESKNTIHNGMLFLNKTVEDDSIPDSSMEPSETFMTQQPTHEQTISSNRKRSLSVGDLNNCEVYNFSVEDGKKKNAAERLKQYRTTKKKEHELLQQEVLYLRTENKRLSFQLEEAEKRAQKAQGVKAYMTSAAYSTMSSIGSLVQLINDNLTSFKKEIFDNLGADTEEVLQQAANISADNYLAVSPPASGSDGSGELGHGLKELGFNSRRRKNSLNNDDIFENIQQLI